MLCSKKPSTRWIIFAHGGSWGPIAGFWFPEPEIFITTGGAGRGADHGAADCASGGDHGGDTGASN